MTRLEAQARQFDRENPQVWRLIRRFTLQAIARGFRNFGIGAVWERMRWEVAMSTNTRDGFKLNNNHRAYYARKFMRRYPEHAGFFRTRTRRGDNFDFG